MQKVNSIHLQNNNAYNGYVIVLYSNSVAGKETLLLNELMRPMLREAQPSQFCSCTLTFCAITF